MIEPWLQELVGIPYVDSGCSPAEGFHCTGLVRYIYRKKFNVELPIDPILWRQTFREIPISGGFQPYDLLVFGKVPNEDSRFENIDTHVAIVCGDIDMIHAVESCRSVVIERMERYLVSLRSAFRLR